jgi:hypothetical protein
MNMAFNMYLQESKGKAWYYKTDYDSFWMSQLLKFQGKNVAIRLCPETPDPRLDTDWGGVWTHWGDGSSSIDWMRTHQGSYCFNGWLYRLPSGATSGHPIDYSAKGPDYFINLPTHNTSDIPVFCDSTWVDAWPDTFDPPPGNPFNAGTPPQQTGAPYMMHRVTMPRHGLMTQMVFMDGSARRMRLKECWLLRWNAKWVNNYDPKPWPAGF